MIRIEIRSVRNPKWSDASRTRINCLVQTNYLEGEYPFTADPFDTEPHGREIFRRCVAGEFGPIAEPEPVRNTSAEKAGETKSQMPAWISAWPEIHEFLEEANQESRRGTVRGVVLVWGAMLETVLQRYLREHMCCQRLTRSSLSKIYHKDIRNFGGAIYVCSRMCLIDQTQFESLEAVREIRNDFAHRWSLSLRDVSWKDKIIPHFRRLHENFGYNSIFREEVEYLARMIYSSACAQMTIQISEATVKARHQT